ncbi:hypothetical protein TCAL_06139 [Tigriopus californicus]|uniref:Calponin-homology (CH) domain-containing protein n=1 Tax=Tigriopus californicus TaxID=6832 RepID=A0A553NYV6_TIGCA|nr:hypothetical protein TCAL_06139 [Tigriopus californicus]
MELIAEGKTKQKPPTFHFPESDLPCRWSVQPGTWFARDNVYNFIKFCRILGVMQCVMFETEDLVCRKNEKHVILTILEVARRGAKIGMLAPMLVQFEQEIDREIASRHNRNPRHFGSSKNPFEINRDLVEPGQNVQPNPCDKDSTFP